jgi:hypothetical protein
MNPQTRKTPTDQSKYNEQYLNALRIQASNNQLNQNANVILRQTGATPTVPTDFRGTTEKYADFEGMKILLETNLKSITNGMNASNIVATLTPAEVQFASNAFPLIKETLSKRYALGVPAEVAVQFIRDLQRKEAQTRGVEFGLQQGTGNDILLSAQQILGQMVSKADLDALRRVLQSAPATPARRQVEEDIRDIERMLPSQSDFNKLQGEDPEFGLSISQVFNELLDELPTSAQVQASIVPLETAIRAGDVRAVEQAEISLHNIMAQDPDTVSETVRSIQEIRRARPLPSAEEMSMISDLTTAPAETELTIAQVYPQNGTTEQKKRYIKQMLQKYPDLELTSMSGRTITADSTLPRSHAELNYLNDQIKVPSQPSQPSPETDDDKGKGLKRMKGKGLAQPRVRKNRLEHLTDGVVERPKPYMPFGRYVIHKYDLEGGKLSMKTPKGGNIKELPSQKISMGLVKVLKSIGKGALPSYDEIKGLGETDKETLHKVITHSRLNDKVSVPTPQSKTEEEKIADRFDILRGEIVAGNDNKQLVKEFKVLLMKLLSAGRVPRKEAHDILTDLASIGL